MLFRLDFTRRDVLLILASLFFIVGLLPFIDGIFAILIGVGLFFGIKFFVMIRQKTLQTEIGQGFCAICGEKIQNNLCPTCDSVNKR